MSEPFVGEIRIFAGNFPPRAWAFCDGQLIQVSQNDALFALIGTIYGGDGRTTFALPDLRGRVPIHMGTGPGLSQRRIGERSGAETSTLNAANLPSHSHQLPVGPGDSANPSGRVPGNAGSTAWTTGGPLAGTMAQGTTAVGNSAAHNNVMPFVCLNFIIALFGVFPSRN